MKNSSNYKVKRRGDKIGMDYTHGAVRLRAIDNFFSLGVLFAFMAIYI